MKVRLRPIKDNLWSKQKGKQYVSMLSKLQTNVLLSIFVMFSSANVWWVLNQQSKAKQRLFSVKLIK